MKAFVNDKILKHDQKKFRTGKNNIIYIIMLHNIIVNDSGLIILYTVYTNNLHRQHSIF